MANEFFRVSNFEVNIDGLQQKKFAEIEGLNIYIQPIDYQEGATALQQSRKGETRYGDITLRRRFDGDKELIQWIKDNSQKSLTKKNGSIIIKDDDHNEVLRFNFTNSWVYEYNAPKFTTIEGSANELTFEEITLRVETLEMV